MGRNHEISKERLQPSGVKRTSAVLRSIAAAGSRLRCVRAAARLQLSLSSSATWWSKVVAALARSAVREVSLPKRSDLIVRSSDVIWRPQSVLPVDCLRHRTVKEEVWILPSSNKLSVTGEISTWHFLTTEAHAVRPL
jgi:hypothetical protein